MFTIKRVPEYGKKIIEELSGGKTFSGEELRLALCEVDGAAMGYGALDTNRALVADVFVLPGYRLRGYGGAILGTLEMYARNLGLSELSVLPEPGARVFFIKRGYSEISDPGGLMTRSISKHRCR